MEAIIEISKFVSHTINNYKDALDDTTTQRTILGLVSEKLQTLVKSGRIQSFDLSAVDFTADTMIIEIVMGSEKIPMEFILSEELLPQNNTLT